MLYQAREEVAAQIITCSQGSSSNTSAGASADTRPVASVTALLSETSTAGLQYKGDFTGVGALLVCKLHLELSWLGLVQDAVSGHAEQAVWPAVLNAEVIRSMATRV